MKASAIALLTAGLLCGAAAFMPAKADVILQTGTYTGNDPGDYTVIGDGTNGGSRFIGARFSLSGETQITDISVGIGQFGSGDFFAAIVPLADSTAFPSIDPASLASVALGSVLLPGFSSTPTVVSGNPSVDLAAGNYAVVFGSGLFGATGFGPITDGNAPAGNGNLFESLFDNTWFNFDDSGILVEVDGTPTAVPEPSSLAVIIAGLAGFGFMLRRRAKAL